MIHTIPLLVALVLPAPYHAPPSRAVGTGLGRSPTWGKDPVKVARFNTFEHMTHAAQMKAQALGQKTYEVYLAERRANRMPVVGQFQVSTSTTYSVSQAIPFAPALYAAPAPFYPSFVHGR